MRAIILKRSDFRENDQLVTLFSLEKGKITALARGVKKVISKNSAYLEPFFYIDAEILPGKDIAHLTKAVGLDCFKNIRLSYEKSVMAARAVALVNNMLQEKERDPAIFRLLLRWLQYANKQKILKTHFFGFVVRFFHILGYRPFFNELVCCSRRISKEYSSHNQFNFSPAGGGIICASCLTQNSADYTIFLKADDIHHWQKFLDYEVANWPLKISLSLEKAIWLFSEYHSEKKLAKISGI